MTTKEEIQKTLLDCEINSLVTSVPVTDFNHPQINLDAMGSKRPTLGRVKLATSD